MIKILLLQQLAEAFQNQVRGVCWAFAAADAVTALVKLKRGVFAPLSRQHVIDCLYKKYPRPPGGVKCEEKTGCYGAHCISYFRFAKDHGVCTDSDYPYRALVGTCKKSAKQKPLTKIDDFWCGSTESIEKILDFHPVCAILPNVPSLHRHSGESIYMGPTAKDEEYEKKRRAKNMEPFGWHAVLVIGYGKERDVEYYIIKNCWGDNWGYLGYAKVAKSVLSDFSYPIIGNV